MSVLALHPQESQTTQREYKAAISVDNAKRLGMHPLAHLIRRDPPEASRAEQRNALPRPTDISAGTTRAIGYALLIKQGGDLAQWNCLDELWGRESHWDPYATNSSSGAYGIPQALPAWKMASAGADWRTNPRTQERWGLSYIVGRYGTACAALYHSNEYGYY